MSIIGETQNPELKNVTEQLDPVMFEALSNPKGDLAQEIIQLAQLEVPPAASDEDLVELIQQIATQCQTDSRLARQIVDIFRFQKN